MGYKLFLDDTRIPSHCVTYMHSRMGARNPIYLEYGWVICKNYGCFVSTIEDMGLPTFVSFDHDLAEEHYILPDLGQYEEKTGYDCAKWLVEYCLSKNLKIPDFTVHSMNVSGTERIFSLLNRFKQLQNDSTKDEANRA